MASPITVVIEITPALKQYLVALYGPEPISFPRKHRFIVFLLRLTEKPQVKTCFLKRNKPNTLEIVLPYSKFKDPRVYNYIGHLSQQKIRKAVWIEFLADFEEFVIENKLKNKYTRHTCIIMFLLSLNITEDMASFGSFYRLYSRAQFKMKQNKLTAINTFFSLLKYDDTVS